MTAARGHGAVAMSWPVISRTGMATALLERDSELAELGEVLEEARAGRGGLVLVEGPPGIGKTRLLDVVRSGAAEQGMTVLSARASELDRDFPFGVVRQLFEPFLSAAGAVRRKRFLHGAASLAVPLVSAGSVAAEDDAARVDAAPARFHALYWLTANLAEEAPVALVIDDVQWADAASLRFLGFLLPRLEELPVLLALASRPSEPGIDRRPIDALATDALALVLRPAPLTDRAVATLVETDLGGRPDEQFTVACHQATGGNPFLIRELLRELAAEGLTPTADQVAHVSQLAPPTVARAVLLRLARLGDEASALARAVAVLGDDVQLRRASALAELPDERANELASALGHAGILAAKRPLAFEHPVLRAVVYADIDPAKRAAAHRRAAALLADEGAGPDAIAVHLLASEPAGDPAVVATLREAAALAVRRGAAGAAVMSLRRALAEPPPAASRGALVLDLASAELRAGEHASAADHFEEGLRIVNDPRSRAAHAWEQALALQSLGRHDEAYALRERAVEEVAGIDQELALRVEASLIASASLDRTRLAAARARLERHRERLSNAATAAEHRLLATRAYLDAMYGDAPANALADAAQRALASGLLVDEVSGFVTTPFFSAIEVLWLADRAEPAKRALEAAIDHARRRGSALAFACDSGWRCMLRAREGALADAEAEARGCAELSLDQGGFVLAPPMLGHVIEILIDRGELDDAERLLERAGMTTHRAGEDLTFYPMLHARARLRAARGDVAGGRADLAAIGVPARWNTHAVFVPAVLAAPELASPDRDEARAAAERMLSDARGWGTARAVGMALRAAGLVEGGTRGMELLEEAARVLAGSPARLEYAAALTDLGAALRRSGRRADARDPLRRALDVAHSCGAKPLGERVRHELRAAGGRPRRPQISGVEALTASERRIAAMAAGGLSNPEIAQALFITKKTVEAHLASAYRKLDIHSRTQLPEGLGADSS